MEPLQTLVGWIVTRSDELLGFFFWRMSLVMKIKKDCGYGEGMRDIQAKIQPSVYKICVNILKSKQYEDSKQSPVNTKINRV